MQRNIKLDIVGTCFYAKSIYNAFVVHPKNVYFPL